MTVLIAGLAALAAPPPPADRTAHLQLVPLPEASGGIDGLDLTWRSARGGLTVQLHNERHQRVHLDWNQSAFVDPGGRALALVAGTSAPLATLDPTAAIEAPIQVVASESALVTLDDLGGEVSIALALRVDGATRWWTQRFTVDLDTQAIAHAEDLRRRRRQIELALIDLNEQRRRLGTFDTVAAASIATGLLLVLASSPFIPDPDPVTYETALYTAGFGTAGVGLGTFVLVQNVRKRRGIARTRRILQDRYDAAEDPGIEAR